MPDLKNMNSSGVKCIICYYRFTVFAIIFLTGHKKYDLLWNQYRKLVCDCSDCVTACRICLPSAGESVCLQMGSGYWIKPPHVPLWSSPPQFFSISAGFVNVVSHVWPHYESWTSGDWHSNETITQNVLESNNCTCYLLRFFILQSYCSACAHWRQV